ncbi:MAG TPA: triose-phosphate isomerase [Rhabdochlamydiaceae bacterium]|nr:triose-phosphate isomerase [Rhabdochlamydiaceae bacterium]
MNRRPMIAGNWKMYKTAPEAKAYIQELAPMVAQAKADVLLAVPFTALHAASASAHGTDILIGAQNMHDADEGAFTGEVSAHMLKDAGAKCVILGHSERRQLFQESNTFINRKLKRALQAHLLPILCIGESQQERDEGKTGQVLCKQLEECLAGLASEQIGDIVVAYEPIWAIGTGRTATPEIAQKTHAQCRDFIAGNWGKSTAARMRILYGGSVKPETIADQMAQPDIDGALVGGASLDPKSFAKIVTFDIIGRS